MRPEELKPRLRGVIVTPAVPMHQDGRIDADAIRRLSRFLVQHGIRDGTGAIVAASSTGEFMSLSEREFDEVIAATVEGADGQVPVLAGTNHMSTAGAVDRSRRAQAHGAVGVLVGPPFYWRPSREEVLAHFASIAEAIDVGILIYNNHFATQHDLDVDLLEALARLPGVVGMKESTWAIRKLEQVVRALGDRIAVLNGPGEWHEPAARLCGAPGFVSPLASVAPEVSLRLDTLMRANDFPGAAALARHFRPLLEFASRAGGGGYIGVLKAAMTLRGIPGGSPRPPLRALNERERQELQVLIETLGAAVPGVATAPR